MTTELKPIASPAPPVWHLHDNETDWAGAIAAQCADALRRDLATGHARLLLSGGGTPAPAYRTLGNYGIDWARVQLGLVDERWLPPGDPDSNGRLVQETLMQGRAAAAQLDPVLIRDRSLDESVRAANASAGPASAVLLGMGPDGHTASLFPGARALAEVLASTQDYVSVDAAGCPGAGVWPLRVSLTPHGIARARLRMMLVRGEAKRRLLERALAGTDTLEYPVRALFALPGAPLQIHWCP